MRRLISVKAAASSQQESLRREAIKLRHQFAQGSRGVFSGVLPASKVAEVINEKCRTWRERVYSPATTLRLFIGQVLGEDRACQDVLSRFLAERTAAGGEAIGLNTGAYCQARQRLPSAVPEQLYREVAEALEEKMPKTWSWHGRRVKVFDGTTVSMPDTPENQKEFPQSSEQQEGLGFPIARLGGLISLGSGAMIGHTVVACEGKGTGEQTLLRGLLPLLKLGDILLADALLATWWVIAEARAAGVDILMPQHGRRITDFSRGKPLGKKDHLVAWRRPLRPDWMSAEAYERYPVEMVMRECEVDGRILVTTLLDPAFVAPRELDDLYALRWTIEVDWRTIKATMEMDVLRCCSPTMVRKEIAVCLLAYNLARWAMATAAALAHLLPRVLGFTGAKRVLVAFAEQLRRSPGRRLTFLFSTVLGAISSLVLPHRPGRVEPRAKKRRPSLPLLTVPRKLAREQQVAKRRARRLNVAT
jgi:hypothetical protein